MKPISRDCSWTGPKLSATALPHSLGLRLRLAAMGKICKDCGEDRGPKDYSKTQWKKRSTEGRCAVCTAGGAGGKGNDSKSNDNNQAGTAKPVTAAGRIQADAVRRSSTRRDAY